MTVARAQDMHIYKLTQMLTTGIDHFHKWRPIINSFANIKISLTNLILKLIIQKSYSETRLVGLI